MANCMTCRHNDKKTKYCLVKKAHTDLGYVLNCIAWTPTDEAEMKRLHAENAKLRELCADLYAEMITYSSAPNYSASVWAQKLRELGVEVE